MESNLYKAAAEGHIEPFREIAKDDLRSLVTHNKNTILHVYVASQRQKEGESVSTKFVEWILNMCPPLLVQVNAKGDAPLHVAAKCGHLAVVEGLIEFAKKQPKELESSVETVRHMLRMTNEEQNTALHEAVQYNSLDVVKILLKTDPNLPYSANVSGQTPLYMAAARRSTKMVDVILQYCPSAAHEGPDGRNALHAAVTNGNSKGWRELLEKKCVIKRLLEKKKSWRRERDHHGWTPLHHAAYLGYDGIISMLLESDTSAACIVDDEMKMTALHLAACQGNRWTAKEIIGLYPECCDMVDDRGWNVLHFAMVSMEIDHMKGLLKEYPMLWNLINEKDMKGNTPLHVLAVVRSHSSYEVVPPNGKGDYQAVNKQNLSVHHIMDYGYPELEKEIEELSKDIGGGGQYYKGIISVISRPDHVVSQTKDQSEGYEKVRASHLVVAALIATVAFAAAFTIPGGYNSSNGNAILRTNIAFQVFITSDTIAMLLSLSAVFIHFLMSMDREHEHNGLFEVTIWFTMISMGAMVIAFVSGTYAMLAPSLGLAIIICFIALSFFFVGVFVLENYVYSRFRVNLIKYFMNLFIK